MMQSPYRFIALRWERRYRIVPVASILRVEARDDRVSVVADRLYPHEATLNEVCAQLAGDGIVRVHRSHAVSLAAVREVVPRTHGEFTLTLRDGSRVGTGRHYRDAIEAWLAAREPVSLANENR